MSSCVDANATTLTTIIAAGLFITSEILPYMSKVKGNGIVEILTLFLKDKISKKTECSHSGEEGGDVENPRTLINPNDDPGV